MGSVQNLFLFARHTRNWSRYRLWICFIIKSRYLLKSIKFRIKNKKDSEEHFTAEIMKEDLVKLFITCVLVFASSLFFTRLGKVLLIIFSSLRSKKAGRLEEC